MSAALRYPMSHAAFEALSAGTGTPVPWATSSARRGTALHAALGPVGPDRGADPVDELARLGLLADGRPDAAVVEALAGFARPHVLVQVDLALVRADRVDRLRAWHRRRASRVTAVTSAGPATELAWWPGAHWSAELGRLVTPALPPTGDEVLPARLRVPFELLVGATIALREGRSAVLADLLDRYAGRMTADDEPCGAVAADHLRTLHTAARGRLQVSVTDGRGRRVRLVSWMLFGDGWRALGPVLDQGEPVVELRSVDPQALGATVTALAAEVRR